jgi:hypothetical protein
MAFLLEVNKLSLTVAINLIAKPFTARNSFLLKTTSLEHKERWVSIAILKLKIINCITLQIGYITLKYRDDQIIFAT